MDLALLNARASALASLQSVSIFEVLFNGIIPGEELSTVTSIPKSFPTKSNDLVLGHQDR